MTSRLRPSTSVHALLSGMTILSLASTTVSAQTATPLPPVQVETEADLALPPLDGIVQGQAGYSRNPGTADTASMLRNVPGMNLITGGGVSALPDLRGLGDDRIKTTVDGMQLSSACPNHMNPALSYIDPSRVGVMEVWAGVSPVSVGGDNIGGTISVKSLPPVFAPAGKSFHTEGSLSANFRSVNDSIGGAAALTAATEDVSLGYTGSWVKARNYYAGGDHTSVHATLYEARNHAATLAGRKDGHLVAVQGGQQFIPYEGFANARMDLTGNRGRFLNGRYEGDFSWGKLEAKAYWQFVQHSMDKINSERSGAMPMKTKGTDMGYSVKAEMPVTRTDTLRLGNEMHLFRLEDWWPPLSSSAMMSPNAYKNIHDGQRDRIGTFVEWENKWTPRWTTLLGARSDIVMMDTGMVNAYSSGGMNAVDARSAAAFNASDRARIDYNFDITALTRYEPTPTTTTELGLARKSRSPNLYERYSWGVQQMDSSMNNWFGDANSYVGDIDLKPEVAHTISVTAGLHDAGKSEWNVRLTPYYTYVVNYIGVSKAGDFSSNNSQFPLLKIANHDAMIYGADISGNTGLWNSPNYGRFDLTGVIGWVHGETVNTGRSLYHMMPINAKSAVLHKLGGWSNAIELELVAAKTETDTIRNEPKTPGYALINLKSGYEWENIQVNLGIDNLLDRRYYHPKGGVDYADWSNNAQKGQVGPLPAPGRSFNAGVTVKF